MPIFIFYLLKLSISLSIVWIFYQLFLRRLTFYKMNRWYLLGYSLLSFLIPLINIGSMVDKDPSRPSMVIQFIPSIGNYGIAGGGTPVTAVAGGSAGWNGWNLLSILLIAGAVLLLIRCIVRWRSLWRIRRKATLIRYNYNEIKIYQVDEPIIPFSFGNAVYINQHLHTEKEREEIILHEYVHVRQRHTVDILLAEVFCVFNWYNPFAWLIRYSIRQNLEFIADHQVVENGFDKKSYQYHLLKVIGEPRYRLANNFNFSSLKKRIIMMNKIRSARLHLLKFLFILPLITVLLVAFRGKYDGIFQRPGDRYINAVGIVAIYPTRQPLAGAIVLDKVSGMTTTTDARGFYRLRIPAPKDSITIRMEYRKEGYSTDWSGHFLPAIKGSQGMIDIGLLISKTDPSHFMMKPPYFEKVPEDPSYTDALAALGETFQGIADMNRFSEMRSSHPEVSLFYTTEDKEHQIIVLTSGEVEKYGYPGAPGLAEMEKKYGRLPEMMTAKTATVGKGYLSEWNKIAGEAEKEFHTTNPNARHIIFPGDSRVIAVPISGKPEVYDMDNNNRKERPAFEKLYGKLPDCVPAVAVPSAAVPATTVPSTAAPTASLATVAVPDTLPSNILYVVDGTPMPQGWSLKPISPSMIYSVSVLKDEKAVGAFGERGANGVICITTKTFYQRFIKLHLLDAEHPLQTPLYIVDGEEISKAKMELLDPNEILSIDVMKGEAAMWTYGERGRDGAILITTKKKKFITSQQKMTVDTQEGKIALQADTIR